jgi:hypothetical protein
VGVPFLKKPKRKNYQDGEDKEDDLMGIAQLSGPPTVTDT